MTKTPWWAWLALVLLWLLVIYLIAGTPPSGRCERLGGSFDLYGDCKR